MSVQFEETKHPLSPEEISAAEKDLGLELPEEYVDHLLNHNGGSPEPGTFAYSKPDQKTARSTVAWFFNVGPYEYENLVEYFKDFKGRVPLDLIPIARDPGGSLILLGVKGKRRGKILFWDRRNEAAEGSAPWERNVYPLADSLEEFLNLLGSL